MACRCPGPVPEDPSPLENAADRGRSHTVAECEQPALDSLVSPALIFPGQTLHQHDHQILDGWTPATVWICPLRGDQTTMPTQDRARRDQPMPPQHPGRHCCIGGSSRAGRLG
jgi:hypothetical protein